ncbi:MAG: hypothetical protein ACI8Z5_002243 [Lentimonas sp.]|jgi:hypothetical protein
MTTYTDETAYQIELLHLGYSTLTESFEEDAAWGRFGQPYRAAP